MHIKNNVQGVVIILVLIALFYIYIHNYVWVRAEEVNPKAYK